MHGRIRGLLGNDVGPVGCDGAEDNVGGDNADKILQGSVSGASTMHRLPDCATREEGLCAL